MSRLWGLIKTLQIILLLPLTLVDIPANVQLLYFFMTYNFNLEFLNLDALKFKFITIEDTYTQESDRVYNDKFDD